MLKAAKVCDPDYLIRLMNRANLAHLADDGRKQTLSEHLLGVSARAGHASAKLQLGLAGELIGLLHDLGKATTNFQEYLLSFGPQSEVEPQDELRGMIDHSTAGAQIVSRKLPANMPGQLELLSLIALPIVSHHSGLIDCVSAAGGDVLQQRLAKPEAKTRAEEAWGAVDAEVRAKAEVLLCNPLLWRELGRRVGRLLGTGRKDRPGDREHLQIGLLLRMLFSCLIDADRTDTANFESPAAARLRSEGNYARWDVLLDRLHEELRTMPSESEVNRLRRAVSERCFANAKRARGSYTLTVPTGGGKTLAALRFALEHARVHSLDRVVFVSPYISIVEQNAEVVRRVLEPPGVPFASVVLEHHSNLPFEEAEGKQAREQWRRKVLAENWDAPVVFTTMVQVLEALFSGGTRAVRRLHALAQAVIVFDEAQTVPMRMLHLFNNAVNFLVNECGSTVVLCTATQPELHTVDPVRGAVQMAAEPELDDEGPQLFQELQRYVVQDESARPGGWTQQEVADTACALAEERGSCLVILNTKADARTVFERCRQLLPEARIVHLSTGMCPAHRAQKLAELNTWLMEQNTAAKPVSPIVCVSTQLIEAGVDIDFAAAIRDLAGLDSIAQAAGRCNRHGTRLEKGLVLIVRLPDLPAKLIDIAHGQRAAERVLGEWRRSSSEPFPLHDPAQMKKFFGYLLYERREDMPYRIKGKDVEREDTLLSMLGANRLALADAQSEGRPVKRAILHQSFMEAGRCFQVIEPTQGIVVPFGQEGKKIVGELCAAYDLMSEWQTLRKAQRYTVSVHPSAFRKLREERAVYEAEEGTGVFCLQPNWYDEEYGLREEAGMTEANVV